MNPQIKVIVSGLGCSNRKCWYTYWRVLETKERERPVCPRCGSKSEILFENSL